MRPSGSFDRAHVFYGCTVCCMLFVIILGAVVGAGVGPRIVSGVDRDVEVVVVPFVGKVMLVGGERLEQHAVGCRARVDAVIGDIDL